jgi:molybdenum-dependent DNA-binding transcriptional regulator ModE
LSENLFEGFLLLLLLYEFKEKAELQEAIQLQKRIDTAIKETERNYEDALEAVKKMKEEINEIELSISRKGRSSFDDSEVLNTAIEGLNQLTDSLILRSERVEEEYKKLEEECEVCVRQPAKLEDLRALSSKTKELAMNLLCFSLGHFERKKV